MLFNLKRQPPQYLVKTVRIIGDRAAGKTTYLTALASLPCDDPNSKVTRIIPSGKNTENMIRQAKDCLEQKVEITPNDYGDGLEKSYVFKVEFKDSSILEIECKDYPGEFFRDLVYHKNPQLLEKYIKDCVELAETGILILLDGTAQQDEYYSNCIYELLARLDKLTPVGSPSRRVAVALTKCDIPQLWIHRKNPTEKIRSRFEGVQRKLKDFNKITVDYFATSAYGMLGNDRETQNSRIIKSDQYGTRSIINESDPKLWRPFGIIDPIYWLYTGKKHEIL